MDSIIFDLDGTLWNASKTAAKAWNKAFKEIGINDIHITDKMIQKYSGIRLSVLLETEFSNIPKEKRKEFIEVYSRIEKEIMKDGGELFEGVETTLLELYKKKSLFIVCNCLEGYIENFLEINKLTEIFKGYEYSGMTQKTKSENIRAIISKYKLINPVYVGDTMLDKEASKKAGVEFVYAEYGFGKVKEVKYKIKEISGLLSIVK